MAQNTAIATKPVSAKPKAPRGKKPVVITLDEIELQVMVPYRVISFGNRYGRESTAMIITDEKGGKTLHVHREAPNSSYYVYQPDPEKPVRARFNLARMVATPPSKPRKTKGNQRRK